MVACDDPAGIQRSGRMCRYNLRLKLRTVRHRPRRINGRLRALRAAFEMACPPPQTERVLECSWCSAELSTGRVYELAIDVNGHPECPSCGDRNNLRVRGGR